MGEGETHTALVTRIADLPSAMCPNIVASVYLRGQAESRPIRPEPPAGGSEGWAPGGPRVHV